MYNKIFGTDAQQQSGVPSFFNNLLERYNPARIIELGTGRGGLSVLLALWCYGRPKYLYTFEINYKGIDIRARDILTKLGAHMFKDSIFSVIPYIAKLIQQDDKVLLLCDNGNKKKELETFAPLLKSGDIIMAHDYCTSMRVFKANKIYKGRSCELTYDDIKIIVEQNNLSIIKAEPLYMWAVMEKL